MAVAAGRGDRGQCDGGPHTLHPSQPWPGWLHHQSSSGNHPESATQRSVTCVVVIVVVVFRQFAVSSLLGVLFTSGDVWRHSRSHFESTQHQNGKKERKKEKKTPTSSLLLFFWSV